MTMQPAFLETTRLENGASMRLAYHTRPGKSPTFLWAGGFRSDMNGTKAMALEAALTKDGFGFCRFDYSGHGESEGRFEDGTISQWLADLKTIVTTVIAGPVILIGSSMGGWLSLRLAETLRQEKDADSPVQAMLLIAPAPDFTQDLMWERFSDEIKASIETDGVYLQSSEYDPEPTPITKRLIEDGRNHLMLNRPLRFGCPVHIVQGMADPDVPYGHVLRLVDHMAEDEVRLTLVKDGDHRLSREQDLKLLCRLALEMAQ